MKQLCEQDDGQAKLKIVLLGNHRNQIHIKRIASS